MLCSNILHNLSWDVRGSVSPCNNIIDFPKFSTVDEMYESKEYKNLLHDSTAEIKSSYCTRCWDKESLKLKSKRQLDLQLHELYKKINPNYLKIDSALGNVCNAACVICGPDSSSLWQKYIPINKISKQSEVWSVCNEELDKIVQLDFGGGEPWLNQIDEQLDLLEQFIQIGANKYIKIRYNTNGSLYPKKLLEKLINFREVEITLSIDDIEDRFEYNRWPLKWSEVLTNIEKLKLLRDNFENIILTINFTVSVFTWQRYQSFLNWADSNNLNKVNPNILTYPEIYSIKSISHKEKFSKTQFDNVVGITPLNNWKATLVDTLNNLDKNRNTNWRKIFPELSF